MQRLQDCGLSFAQGLGQRSSRARCSCALDRQLERIELAVLGAVQTSLVGRFRSESLYPSVAGRRPGRRIDLHNDAGG